MGIYQQLLIRLKRGLTHLHLTGSPTFANALNCQDDRSAVIEIDLLRVEYEWSLVWSKLSFLSQNHLPL